MKELKIKIPDRKSYKYRKKTFETKDYILCPLSASGGVMVSKLD